MSIQPSDIAATKLKPTITITPPIIAFDERAIQAQRFEMEIDRAVIRSRKKAKLESGVTARQQNRPGLATKHASRRNTPAGECRSIARSRATHRARAVAAQKAAEASFLR